MRRHANIIRSGRSALAVLAGLALVLAACGGGDESADASAAVDVVGGFIDGWEAASGLRSDTLRAGQTRQYLGGDLRAQVDGSRPGEGLEREYNRMVDAPFPPDEGYDVIGEPELGDLEATVRVRLNYSGNIASRMAAVGLVGFEDVSAMQSEVSGGLERTFILRSDDDAGWLIHEITE